MEPVLTIAVPTFNMESCLAKNLATYCDQRLESRLEVICLNNASEDGSKEIILRYVKQQPEIFRLYDRDTRGYGSSINAAIKGARGRYFRIVDADDWVDTEELVQLVERLGACNADVVLTDYQIVDMGSGRMTSVRAGEKDVCYGVVYHDFTLPIKTLPSIHGTTYRTGLLRECGFYMQDNMFFVDEEYVVLPYLAAKSVEYFPFDVYRYQVANPQQSTSPKNRAKFREHREKILRRLIGVYIGAERSGESRQALPYCFERIRNGVGDHFTTLYMYMENRAQGRKEAAAWSELLRSLDDPRFYRQTACKARILCCLNRLHIGLQQYEFLKQIFKRKERNA
ncbi:MAG: glycosyltransferase [Agathobaculum sp.]|uniref:glycosyltransferase family 2 protein n=1 Tax=Agathobaculum sp. TaxID=2048138 RepID=UPI0025B9A248|nr:glycosyltransferase family 2 protein [Agathobaculum sp.]MCI7126431.1 glycosyltransferase [Agathobaculum sp.]